MKTQKTTEGTVIELPTRENGYKTVVDGTCWGRMNLTCYECAPKYRVLGLQVELTYYENDMGSFWMVSGELITGR